MQVAYDQGVLFGEVLMNGEENRIRGKCVQMHIPIARCIDSAKLP